MPELLSLETARGLVEKVQPFVRFPTLMRVVLPGALATVVVYPFTGLRTDFFSAELASVWRELVSVLVMVFVLGALIAALSGQVYKIYEGRIVWPQFLFDWFTGRQSRKIQLLLKAAEKANEKRHKNQYDEIWYRLRTYPVDEKGEPQATHPTLLGNILAAYEDYPRTRHGMDSVFYWPRLWLEMGKDIKDEIDGMWSIADGFLNMSAVSFLGGMFWLLSAAIRTASSFYIPMPLGSPGGSALAGVSLVVISYCFYRVSVPFHRNNGEVFKALFDLYRDKLKVMTRLGPEEVAAWKGTWSYLQYLRVFCLKCKKYFPAHLNNCKFCGHPTAESLKQLTLMAGPHGPGGARAGIP